MLYFQPIEPLIIPNLSGNQLARIREIDDEDFNLTAMKARRDADEHNVHLSDSALEQGILGLKQYYAIALLDPENPHAVSPLVDPFWHAHILHTRQYAGFCDRVMGCFMHHEPLDPNNVRKVARIRMLYDYTVDIMPKVFCSVDTNGTWPTRLTDASLICMHFGKSGAYPAVAGDALFPPVLELQS